MREGGRERVREGDSEGGREKRKENIQLQCNLSIRTPPEIMPPLK